MKKYQKLSLSLIFIFLTIMVLDNIQQSRNPWGEYCKNFPNGSYLRRCVKIAVYDLNL